MHKIIKVQVKEDMAGSGWYLQVPTSQYFFDVENTASNYNIISTPHNIRIFEELLPLLHRHYDGSNDTVEGYIKRFSIAKKNATIVEFKNNRDAAVLLSKE